MPVYFVRAGEGPVKIGIAIDPEARLRELQTGHYESLSLLRVVDGDWAVEAWLHARFAAARIRGEWFRYSSEMLIVEPQPKVGVTPLDHWMRDNDVTDQAFGELVGVDRATICRYRLGRRMPNAEMMRRIHEATRGAVTPNDFVGVGERAA